MVKLIQIALVVAIMLACIFAKPIELYSDKYDYIDIWTVLKNNRLRQQYYQCFTGDGPCTTAPARHFKGTYMKRKKEIKDTIIHMFYTYHIENYLPHAFATQCKRCTEKQKEMFAAIVAWYVTHSPKEWQHLVKKLEERGKNLQNNPK
ncbi:ejaculatory bulb-specific protein 3 [Ooceraea biroi]|uniref:ejaculatory bulb-specific protein 3 n=1 Tax=Ooceraea biroi TaxID=2015173 RepID=UPI0009715B68|nr:ejaculatory bulb-specific protein 3 [Ooceraea biroi]